MNEKTLSGLKENKGVSPLSLSQAILSAQQLVAYAAFNCIDINPDVRKTLIDIKHLQEDLTAEQEEAFWNAYSELSKKVQPVTPASLQATLDSRTIINRFQELTIFAIFILLFFQVYWILLTTLLGSVNESFHNIQSVQTEYVNQWDDLLTQGNLYGIERNDILIPQKWEAVKEESKRSEIITKINKFQRYYFDVPPLVKDFKKNYYYLSLIDLFTPTPEDINIRKLDPNAAYKEITFESLTEGVQGTSTASTVTVTVLSTYILPILYGLVGACAYILRALSEYIEKNTFSNSISVRLRLRLLLGILAGLSIAWFFNPESLTTTAGHITPFALAFVAGYSVELLFSAMDAIISAFTRKQEPLIKS